MNLSDINILHITNEMGYGGVQKIIYQLCKVSKGVLSSVRVASAGGVYVNELNSLGVEHIMLPDLSSKNPFDIMSIIIGLKRIIDECNINIIHCHHRMAVFYAKLLVSEEKIVYGNHVVYSDKRYLSRWLLKNIKVIAVSEATKRNAINFFKIPDWKIEVINNAVEGSNYEYVEIPEIAEERNKGKFIVANIARLHPQKGINYFIGAAEILIKRGCDICFFIIGDGSQEEEAAERIKKAGLEKQIIHLGFKKDIQNIMRQIDLLVLTSLYEGMPLTPMEAFSVSRTVVGTDVDGTREVITDGYDGLLAESRNSQSIADCVEKLYRDRIMLKKLENNAYQTYLRKYNIKVFANNYLHYYADF